MKISEINIKKFRQLENINESNIGLINELYGSNGCGKTSFISFITWMIYGETIDYGKNDDMNIDSYKPNELIGGDIVLTNKDNGEKIKLSREYGYNELNKKINNFYVNDRKVSRQDDYYYQVNKGFNLNNLDNIKIKNFNLQRALSDPYYLPNNETQFRELITHILNLDTFNVLFNENEKYNKIKEDLIYQDKDFDKCKDYYNSMITKLEKELMQINSIMLEYKNSKFDEEKYNDLLKELNETNKLSFNNNKEIEEKYNEINKLQLEIVASKEEDIKHIEISDNKKELNDLKIRYNNLVYEYNSSLQYNNSIKSTKKLVKEKIELLNKDLEEVKKSTFKEIYCPNCNTLINEDDYKKFNQNKIERLKYIKDKIKKSNEELESYTEKDIAPMVETLNKYLSRLDELKAIVSNEKKDYVSDKTKQLIDKYNNLSQELNNLINEDNEKKEKFINEKQNKVDELSNQLLELSKEKDKQQRYLLSQNEKNKCLEEKMNYELKLSLLKEYKNDELTLIKNATNKIFGDEFQFEMLVKNKLNDNYKKVCYASIDGLEHNKSNTAKYLKLSIILLEKLKKYIGDCDIPIIFDISDNIGKTARNEIFNSIQYSQIFYTRIADEDNVNRELKIIK